MRGQTASEDVKIFKIYQHYLQTDQHGQKKTLKTTIHNLRSIDVSVQKEVWLGWPHDLEVPTSQTLKEFVGGHPIVNSQGFSRPWHGPFLLDLIGCSLLIAHSNLDMRAASVACMHDRSRV